MVPSHYLNQFWLIIKMVVCDIHLKVISLEMLKISITDIKFENYLFKIAVTSPRGQQINTVRNQQNSQSFLCS